VIPIETEDAAVRRLEPLLREAFPIQNPESEIQNSITSSLSLLGFQNFKTHPRKYSVDDLFSGLG
jgi:hypothetical protein